METDYWHRPLNPFPESSKERRNCEGSVTVRSFYKAADSPSRPSFPLPPLSLRLAFFFLPGPEFMRSIDGRGFKSHLRRDASISRYTDYRAVQ